MNRIHNGIYSPLLKLLIVLALNCIALSIFYLVFPDIAVDALNSLGRMFTNYKWDRLGEIFFPLTILMLTEAYFLGWKKSSIYRLLHPSGTAINDLVIGGIHILGFAWVLVIVFTFGFTFIAQKVSVSMLGFDLLKFVDNPFLEFAIWLVVLDFVYYWYHRTAHTIGFLWEAHKYHHAATEFNIITGNREHALDKASHMLIQLVPMTMLGAPAETFIGIMIVRRAIDIYQHSMLPWDFGWVGRWLIYSPIGHRIHHSMEREHWDINFGNISPIWDRLFGTWYAGDKINEEVGVTDNPYNKNGPVSDYMYCFTKTLQVFLNSIRTGRWLRR